MEVDNNWSLALTGRIVNIQQLMWVLSVRDVELVRETLLYNLTPLDRRLIESLPVRIIVIWVLVRKETCRVDCTRRVTPN